MKYSLLIALLALTVSVYANDLGSPKGSVEPCNGEAGSLHENGGGFVSSRSSVDPEVFVSEDSEVCGKSIVNGPVRILNKSKLFSYSKELNPIVSGDSVIDGSVVRTGVRITDSVIVSSSVVYRARVWSSTIVDSYIGHNAAVRNSEVVDSEINAGLVQGRVMHNNRFTDSD